MTSGRLMQRWLSQILHCLCTMHHSTTRRGVSFVSPLMLFGDAMAQPCGWMWLSTVWDKDGLLVDYVGLCSCSSGTTTASPCHPSALGYFRKAQHSP